MGNGGRLGEQAMSRFDVLHMIKRRAKATGLPLAVIGSERPGLRVACRTPDDGACPDHSEPRIAPHD